MSDLKVESKMDYLFSLCSFAIQYNSVQPAEQILAHRLTLVVDDDGLRINPWFDVFVLVNESSIGNKNEIHCV